MRRTHSRLSSALFILTSIALLLVCDGPLMATTYTWDIDPGTVGIGNGTITGGAGTWDTTNGNWTTDGGANNVAWPTIGTDNDAVFGGTAGAVTISGGVTANDLTFNTTGYSVTSSTLTLGGTTPTVTVGSGLSATISSTVAGSDGLTKAGSGILTLSGANTYTGTTIVNSGTAANANTASLLLATPGTDGVGTVAVNDNLQIGNGGAGVSVVQLGGNDEIVKTANLTFNATSGNWGYLQMKGYSQTFATINDSGTTGTVIENYESTAGIAGTSLLTINGSGNSSITGWMRDIASGVHATNKLGLYKDGDGTMTLDLNQQAQFSGGITVNGGFLSYTGTVAIAAQTLQINSEAFFNYSSTNTNNHLTNLTYNINGGTLKYTVDFVNTMGSADGAGSGNITMTGGTIDTGSVSGTQNSTWGSLFYNFNKTITANGSSNVITGTNKSIGIATGKTLTLSTPSSGDSLLVSGVIGPGNGGTGGISKTGSGTVTFSAANTYTGTTSVTGGTLNLSHTLALQNSTVASGGTGIVFDASVGTHAFTFGGLSGSADLALTDNGANNVALSVGNNNASTTYSGSLSGGGSLTKIGSGTLTLSAANSYTGLTTIGAGVLALDHTSALGGGGDIRFTGGTLQFSANNTNDYATRVKNSTGAASFNTNSQSVTFAGAIDNTNTGGLTKLGAGTLTLTAANTYTGTTTINAGTLALSGGNDRLPTATTVHFSGSGTLNLGNTSQSVAGLTLASSIAPTIAGSGGTLSVGGTVTANSGDNITVDSGASLVVPGSINQPILTSVTWNVNGNLTAGTYSTVTTGGGSGGGPFTHTLNVGNGGNFTATTLNGAILGRNSVTASFTMNIAAGGEATVETIQNFSNGPGASVSNHVVNTLNINGVLNAGTITSNGGTRQSGNTIERFVNINSGGLLNATNVNLGQDISGAAVQTYRLTINNGTLANRPGTDLTVQGGLANLHILNAATFDISSGRTGTINAPISQTGNLIKAGAGTLILNAANNSYTGDTTVSAGTLAIGGAGRLGSGTYAGAIGLTSAASTLHYNSSANQTLSGVISGDGLLTKAGAGTLTLTNSNTYSGATTVNAGTLLVNGSLDAASAVAVNGGMLGGTGTVAGTVAINSGGTIAPGASPGTLNTGATTYAGGGNYQWEINSVSGTQGSDPGWDFQNITGTLNITATSGNKFNINITGLDLSNISSGVNDWNPYSNYTWTIATASGGISGFDAGNFNLQTANFTNNNSIGDGSFSIAQSGNDLRLNFAAATSGVTAYWDINGSTAGAGGATPGGTWSTGDANWSYTASGNNSTNNWINGNDAVFSAGSDATGSYSVTIGGGGVTARHITVEDGTTTTTTTITGDTLTLAGTTPTVTVNASRSAVIDTVIAGSDGLTKSGAGNLTLSGSASNTYSGVTTLTSTGQLILSKTGGAVAVPGNISMEATGSRAILSATQDNQFGTGTVMSFPHADGRDTRFELKGTTQTLAGLDSVGFAGTFAAIQHSEFGAPAAVDAISDLILNVSGANSYTFGNSAGTAVIRNQGGTVRLTKEGTGTQTLTGTGIAYTGATAVNGGTLQLNGVTAWNSDINNSATVEFYAPSNWALNSGTRTVLSGNGTYVKTGTGTVQLYNDTISATGQFLIQAGTLKNDGNSTIWTANTANMDISLNATLDLYADDIYVNSLTGQGTVDNGFNQAQTLFVGVANGSGTFEGIIKNTVNNLSLNKTGTGTQTFSGANTYSGTTTVSAGTLNLSHSLALQNSTAIPGGAGIVFDASVASHAFTFGGLSGSGGLLLEDNAGSPNAVALSVGNNNASSVYSGILSGSGSVTKIGTGPQYFDGSNSYTGSTLVSSGYLVARDNNALGSAASGTTVTSGGTLQLENNITISSENVSIIGTGQDGRGAFGSFTGNNAWNGTVTLTGNATLFAQANTFTINGQVTGTGDVTKGTVSNGGTLVFGGTSSNDYSGTTILGNGTLILNKTGGAVAIPGPMQMGAGTGNQPNLRMSANGQFASGVEMTFANTSGNWARFDLRGTNQTLAGLIAGTVSTQAGAVIQNRELGNSTASSYGPAMLTLNGSGTYLYNGHLRDVDGGTTGTDTLSLVKNGSGTQTLVGTVIRYTGSTSVNQGRLVFTASNASNSPTFGSGIVSIASGAVFEFNAATGTNIWLPTTTYTGAGTIVKSGGGGLLWGSAVGTFNLGAGSLIDVQGGSMSGGSNANENWASNLSSLNIAGSASIDEISYSAAQFDALTGSGTMNANGSATVTLGANNTAAGTYNAAGTATFSGAITGAAAITKIGTGTQTLSGANTYSGETHVNDGTLIISGATSNTTTGIMLVNNGELHLGKTDDALVAAGNLFLQIGDGLAGSATVKLLAPNQTSNDGIEVIISSDGKFDLNGYDQTLNDLQDGLDGGPGTVDGRVSGLAVENTLTVKNGDFSGVIQNSVGTLNLVKDSSGSLVLTGPNAYSGTTAIQNGMLAIGGDNDRLPTGTTVTLGDSGTSGTLRLADMIDPTARNQTLAGLLTSGTGTNNRVTGGGAGISVLTLDIAGTNTFGGILGGSGPNHNNLGLTKTGVGTLELTGANTYSGATIIDSGTLWLNGTAGFSHSGAGAYVVGNGGTLKGDGNLEDHAITFATGSTGAPGNSPGLMLAGSQSWDDNSTYEWEVAQPGAAGVDYDTYAVSGLLDFSAISGTMNLELIKFPGESIALTDTFVLWSYGSLDGWDVAALAPSGKFTLTNPGGYLDFSNAVIYSTTGNGDSPGNIILTGIFSVPEPSTYALALLGLAWLGLIVWRKKFRRA